MDGAAGDKSDRTCSTCGRVFLKPAHLQRHEAVHADDRPFACTACDRAFKREDAMHRHFRSVHRGLVLPSTVTNARPTPVISPRDVSGLQDGRSASASSTSDPATVMTSIAQDHAYALASLALQPPSAPMTGGALHQDFVNQSNLGHNASALQLQTDTEVSFNVFTAQAPLAQSFSPLSSLLAYVSQDHVPPVMDDDLLLSSWFTSDSPVRSVDLHEFEHTAIGGTVDSGSTSQQVATSEEPAPSTSSSSLMEAATRANDESTSKNSARTRFEGNVLSPDDFTRKLKLPSPMEPGADLIPSIKYLDASINLYFQSFHPWAPILHQPTFNRARQPPFITISIVSIGCMYMGSAVDESRAEWIFERLNAVILATRDTWMADPKLARAAFQAAVLGQCFAMLSTKRNVVAESYHSAICLIARDLRQHVAVAADAVLSLQSLASLGDAELKARWEKWAYDETIRRTILMLDYHAAHLTSNRPDMPFQLFPHRPSVSSDVLFEAEDQFAWRAILADQLTAEANAATQPSSFRAACEIGSSFVHLVTDQLITRPWMVEHRSTTVAPFYQHHANLLQQEFPSRAFVDGGHSAQQRIVVLILFHYACLASLIRLDELELAAVHESRNRFGHANAFSSLKTVFQSNSGRLATMHCAAILQQGNALQELVFVVPNAIFHAVLALFAYASTCETSIGSTVVVDAAALDSWVSLAKLLDHTNVFWFNQEAPTDASSDALSRLMLIGDGVLRIPGFTDRVDHTMDLLSLRSSCIKLLKRTSPWAGGRALVDKLLAADV
ncbi:hypothetical protein ACM66B_005979 [Microbotryomycetes sp. NB124-2]